MNRDPLGLGTFIVEAPCPDCGAVLELVLRLSSTRTTSTDDDPKVRLKARSTAVPHVCRRSSSARQVTVAEALAEAAAEHLPGVEVTITPGLPVIVDADLVRTGDAAPDPDDLDDLERGHR